jgi:hypothetical protein
MRNCVVVGCFRNAVSRGYVGLSKHGPSSIKNIGLYVLFIYMIGKCLLVAWLVGDHLLFRDFGPCGIFMTMCYNNRCHGNTVEGFWALRDNIYDYVCLLL